MWVFLMLLLVLPQTLYAQRMAPADKPVTVTLAPGKMTAVIFPEAVNTVAVARDDNRFLVNSDLNYLFLFAKVEDLNEQLFVTGKKGGLYLVSLRVGTPADEIVTLAIPATTKAAPLVDVPSLLRAMRTGTTVPGQQAAEVATPAPNDPRVAIQALQATRIGKWVTLRCVVENTQDTPAPLDIRVGDESPSTPETIRVDTWSFPPRLTLRGVLADTDVLPPHSRTQLYLVFERREP